MLVAHRAWLHLAALLLLVAARADLQQQCDAVEQLHISAGLGRTRGCCELEGITCADGAVREVRFDLAYNAHKKVRGTISSAVGHLTKLKSLQYTQNNVRVGAPISGTLPPQLADLKELAVFRVKSNYLLSGTIPGGLGLRNNALHMLRLERSSVSGTLPPSVCSDEEGDRLVRLDLGRAPISGTLANGCFTSALEDSYLKRTYLSGTLPETVGLSSRLQTFDIQRSFFTGRLPRSLATTNFPDLSTCRLDPQFVSIRGNTAAKRAQGLTSREEADFNCPVPMPLPRACLGTRTKLECGLVDEDETTLAPYPPPPPSPPPPSPEKPEEDGRLEELLHEVLEKEEALEEKLKENAETGSTNTGLLAFVAVVLLILAGLLIYALNKTKIDYFLQPRKARLQEKVEAMTATKLPEVTANVDEEAAASVQVVEK